MKRSTDEILTTHTGSLPRPPALMEALEARDRGEGEQAGFEDRNRMRRAFIRAYGQPPQVIRRQARGYAPADDGELEDA